MCQAMPILCRTSSNCFISIRDIFSRFAIVVVAVFFSIFSYGKSSILPLDLGIHWANPKYLLSGAELIAWRWWFFFLGSGVCVYWDINILSRLFQKDGNLNYYSQRDIHLSYNRKDSTKYARSVVAQNTYTTASTSINSVLFQMYYGSERQK